VQVVARSLVVEECIVMAAIVFTVQRAKKKLKENGKELIRDK
jgi:hypothetical protein